MLQPASKDWVQQQFAKEFGSKLLPTDFYYDSEGRRVMNESYHKRRGSFFGNGFRHSPFEPLHEIGAKTLKMNKIISHSVDHNQEYKDGRFIVKKFNQIFYFCVFCIRKV